MKAWIGAIAGLVSLAATTAMPAYAQTPASTPTAYDPRKSNKNVRRPVRHAPNASLRRSARNSKAIADKEALLVNWEQELGQEHPAIADLLMILADMYEDERQYNFAESYLRRAGSIRRKTFGAKSYRLAECFEKLASIFIDQLEFKRAEALLEQALDMVTKELGASDHRVASIVHGLADVYHSRGEHERAQSSYERALMITKEAHEADDPRTAPHEVALAALHTEQGDYARAEALLLHVLSIQERSMGRAHPDLAPALSALASLYTEEAEYALAETIHERALAIREAEFEPHRLEIAESLHGMGVLYTRMARYDHAEPRLKSALAIRERAVGPEHPLVAQSLDELAVLYQARGDLARAGEFAQRSLRITEKALGSTHRRLVEPLNALASIRLETLHYREAQKLAERALMIATAAYAPEDFIFKTSLDILAELQIAQGHVQEGLKFKERSIAIEDRRAASMLLRGSEARRRAHMAPLQRSTFEVISLHTRGAPDSAEAARLATTVILRRKGLLLDAMTNTFAVLRTHPDSSDDRLLTWLASVQSRLAAHFSVDPRAASAENLRAELDALEEDRQRIEEELSKRSTMLRGEPSPVSLTDVQGEIPEGAALVEIVLYEPLDLKTVRRGARGGEPRYAAYVLRRTGDVTWVDLGEATPIDAAVDKLRRALARPAGDPRQPARDLDAMVMQPVRALLGSIRWIFISPDGALNLVPFGALRDENGGYLIERYSFTYLTTGRDLVRFTVPSAPRGGVTVIADPAFGDPEESRTEQGRGRRSIESEARTFRRLPATAEEARAISERLAYARVLTGTDATEGMVKAVHGPRILHIATHGFFLMDRTRRPEPQSDLAPGLHDGTVSAFQLENPLLHAGLVLTGANQRVSGVEDGILTALEVSGLDLMGTKLVVLSACETGLGEASSGDGVYGLRRALVIAGAETQVMSLWKVDDVATRDLMVAYYERLWAGGGRSEAMRDVQRSMLARDSTSHPFYWASFIVSGNGDSIDGGPVGPAPVGRPGLWGCGCSQVGVAGPAVNDRVWAVLIGLALCVQRGRARASRKRMGGAVRGGLSLLCILLALFVITGCAAPLTCPAAGGAPWTEFTSKQVVLRTDLDPLEARAAFAELQSMYTAMLDVAFSGVQPGERLHVVLFRREVDYSVFGGEDTIDYYNNRMYGDVEPVPMIVTHGDLVNETRRKLKRGIASILIRQSLGGVRPWLAQGLSTYYSTLRIEAGNAYVGAPIPDLGFTSTTERLTEQHGSWNKVLIPAGQLPAVAVLLAADHAAYYVPDHSTEPVSDDERRRRMAAGGGAWMLVHMFIHGRQEYKERFAKLLDALTHGKAWGPAWKLSLEGVDLAQLESDYRSYVIKRASGTSKTFYVPRQPPPSREFTMGHTDVHLLWARLLWARGGKINKDRAKKHIDVALASDPGSLEAHFQKGFVLLKEDRYREAEQELRAALAGRPYEPRYLLALLKLYWSAQDWEGRAERIAETANRLAKVASSATALHAVAWSYAQRGRSEEAMFLLRRAIGQDRVCSMCLDTYADMLFEQGSFQEAADAEESAVNAVSDADVDKAMLDRLERYRAAARAQREESISPWY